MNEECFYVPGQVPQTQPSSGNFNIPTSDVTPYNGSPLTIINNTTNLNTIIQSIDSFLNDLKTSDTKTYDGTAPSFITPTGGGLNGILEGIIDYLENITPTSCFSLTNTSLHGVIQDIITKICGLKTSDIGEYDGTLIFTNFTIPGGSTLNQTIEILGNEIDGAYAAIAAIASSGVTFDGAAPSNYTLTGSPGTNANFEGIDDILGIIQSEQVDTGVVAGSHEIVNITVNAKGRISSVSSFFNNTSPVDGHIWIHSGGQYINGPIVPNILPAGNEGDLLVFDFGTTTWQAQSPSLSGVITDDVIPRGTGLGIEDGTWKNVLNDFIPTNAGSNLGENTVAGRLNTIFMASTFDFTGDLIWTSGGELMRLKTTGELGLGVSPTCFVDFQRDDNSVVEARITNTDAGINSAARWRVVSENAEGAFGVYSSTNTDISGWADHAVLSTSNSNGLIMSADSAPLKFGNHAGSSFTPYVLINGIGASEGAADMLSKGIATSTVTQKDSFSRRYEGGFWDGAAPSILYFETKLLASTTVNEEATLRTSFNGTDLVEIPHDGSLKFLTALTNDDGEDTLLAIDTNGKIITRSAASIGGGGGGDGIYDGSGTIPSATIATLTDYIRFDSGNISVNTGGAPSARLHVKGADLGVALIIDTDNAVNTLYVSEIAAATGFVGVNATTRVGNEKFRVGGNAVINANLGLGGQSAASSGLNMPDGYVIAINGTNVLRAVSGQTRICGQTDITLQDAGDAEIANFDQDASYVISRPASGGSPLRDQKWSIIGQYDNSGTNQRSFDMIHNITASGGSPASQMDMSIEGTLALTLQDAGYPEVPTYTVATLPAVGSGGGIIRVSDEIGGDTLAFSNGSNWVRTSDLATVST